MQPKKRFDSDGLAESLERRLRNLPKLPVPDNLETRLLACIPAEDLSELSHRVSASRPRRRLLSAAGAAFAAACLLFVLLRPKFGDMDSVLHVAVHPSQRESEHKHLFERPNESLPIVSRLADPRLQMYVETQPFVWPIHQESPLMVSSKIPDDLLD